MVNDDRLVGLSLFAIIALALVSIIVVFTVRALRRPVIAPCPRFKRMTAYRFGTSVSIPLAGTTDFNGGVIVISRSQCVGVYHLTPETYRIEFDVRSLPEGADKIVVELTHER